MQYVYDAEWAGQLYRDNLPALSLFMVKRFGNTTNLETTIAQAAFIAGSQAAVKDILGTDAVKIDKEVKLRFDIAE